MPNCDRRIAIYSRKSKFTGKGDSIGNQVELCRDYIRIHYGEDSMGRVAVYEDEGFSGGDLKRPDFQRMMEAARSKKIEAIVVYRLDRISRNIGDFSGLIQELARLGIAFMSIKEQFDTATPMGRAMMYIASVFSQLERETIAERIRDNMHELAKTGRWLGGTTPTGYRSESVKSVSVDGKTKKSCHLRLIPEEAEIVKTIYGLFMESNSLTATEAELMRRRIMTKNGRHFTRFSIKSILQNPVYLIADREAYGYFREKEAELFSDRADFDGFHGILAYNRTEQEKGRATIYLPVRQWIISVGQHPGLIPGREWIGVQNALEQNKSRSYRRPRSNKALLTGVLYCRCGSRMFPKLSARKTADGQPIYTYVCQMKEHSRGQICAGKNVNGNALDAAILTQMETLAGDGHTFAARLEQSRRSYNGTDISYKEQLAGLRQERTDIEHKMEGLIDSLPELEGRDAKIHVAKRIESLQRACEAIDDNIQKLTEQLSRYILDDSEFDLLQQTLSSFRSTICVVAVEQKRIVMHALVGKVIWDGETAHVLLPGASNGPGISNAHWGEDRK